MVLMTNEYNQHGKRCTRVMLEEMSFLVDRTTEQVLDDSLKYIGFSLKGATEGAKSILGNRNLCPLIVNPYKGICLFPNKSPRSEDCIWFNPEHIVKTIPIGKKTEVYFRNGYSIIVDSKLFHFNTKIQQATQLKRSSVERGLNPNQKTFILEPKKELQLSRNNNGKYNFHILNDEKKE